MKKAKEKKSDEVRTSNFNLEKFNKLTEFILIEYKDIEKIKESHNTIIKNFILSSGKIVLTTLNNSGCCANIIFNFPVGNFDVYIHNDETINSIFIPFSDFKSETIRYKLYFDPKLITQSKEIPPFLKATETLFVRGLSFYLMDEEQSIKHKSLVYSDKSKSEKEIINELYEKSNGLSPIITVYDKDNSIIKENKNSIPYYIACCGYTLKGDPAYFWLVRIESNKK